MESKQMPLEIKLTDKQVEILLDRPEDCICECWLDSGVCGWMTEDERKIYSDIMSDRFCEAYHLAKKMIEQKLIIISAEMKYFQLIDWIIQDMVDGSTWDRHGDLAANQLAKLKRHLQDSGLYCVDIIEWCASAQERKQK